MRRLWRTGRAIRCPHILRCTTNSCTRYGVVSSRPARPRSARQCFTTFPVEAHSEPSVASLPHVFLRRAVWNKSVSVVGSSRRALDGCAVGGLVCRSSVTKSKSDCVIWPITVF